MPNNAPYSIEFVSRDGESETKMLHVATEQLALTNATLMRRGAPHQICVIRDGSGKAVHRF